ncbi:mitochondrial ribonuclease P protein 1 homolog [Vespa crabro]|uniref:mitochondrial ribonuclease P protein 1 homolog n=1 Tax=Vespa crabro TaxID=7445 RepID=UPI001EFF9E2D|nr:mitochondrial ribonuclease P protein 1 homolog [Vespa crabro]
MCNFGLKNSLVLFKKLQSVVILSSSFNTNLSKIQIPTHFIKRNFAENLYEKKTKSDIDEKDEKILQQLLQNPDMNKKYKLLQYEYEYLRETTQLVPQTLRPKDYIYLLNSSKTHQRKHFRFLFINEKKRESNIQKREQKIEAKRLEMKKQEEECPSGLKYGLSYNSLFMRIYDKSLDSFLNFNLLMSSMFEPKIVFDCGYDNLMTNHEIMNCAKQLLLSFVYNRLHKNPADIYFCNAPRNNKILTKFHSLIPNVYETNFPLNITSKSYLDIFDKNDLVYLTPHCNKEMTVYNPDKVYIIGALVDKMSPQPYTLAKAKKEGISMEKLPIDRYLRWNTGSTKSLTLNQVLAILIDVKYTKDWMAAFNNNIPIRKLMKADSEFYKKKVSIKTN